MMAANARSVKSLRIKAIARFIICRPCQKVTAIVGLLFAVKVVAVKSTQTMASVEDAIEWIKSSFCRHRRSHEP